MKKILTGKDCVLDFFEVYNPSWEMFEAEKQGNYVLAGIRYSMRFGLYMGSMFQAIMGGDRFVRMRKAPKYLYDHPDYVIKKQDLVQLDPDLPDNALYGNSVKTWHPAQWRRTDFDPPVEHDS